MSSSEGSTSGLADEGVVLSATVIVGSAIAGLAFGFAIDILGHTNGRPSTSKKFLKTAKYALQGFALGSLVAGTLITISAGNEKPRR